MAEVTIETTINLMKLNQMAVFRLHFPSDQSLAQNQLVVTTMVTTKTFALGDPMETTS